MVLVYVNLRKGKVQRRIRECNLIMGVKHKYIFFQKNNNL